MAIAMALKEYLKDSGIHYKLIKHDFAASSMRTADVAHISGEKLAKAVVLNDGKDFIVAVVPATHQVQLGKLHKHFNRYLALASEDELHELFADCSVGAIPPIGRAYGIEVIFDDRLNECADVYFEAGDHTDLVHISGSDFRNLMAQAYHGEISRHV